MGPDRSPTAGGEADRSTPHDGLAQGDQRAFPTALDRLPMAHAAQGVSAPQHGAPLLHGLARGRHLEPHPPWADHRGARTGGARAPPFGRGDRQSVGENRGKAAAFRAMTRPRRSRAGSVTSWSIPLASCWSPWSTPPTSRTATAPSACFAPCEGSSLIPRSADNDP